MKKSGQTTWKAPSNIALVKYWGKYGRQLPKNPSISFTLSQAHTITKTIFDYDNDRNGLELNFKFEGQENPKFASKIDKFLKGITDILPMINHLRLDIESENSFPHSSGIASSASSMAALAMCLVSIEQSINDLRTLDLQKASHIARLGSGSASRSVIPQLAIWGESSKINQSSNLHAIEYGNQVNPIFHNFRDDILIVSKKEKSVSSRAGHALMVNNPYSEARYTQAHNHLDVITEAMKDGDLDTFGMIVEQEALTLHALMMASDPPYILMEPNTLNIIRMIQSFRKDTMVPVYFTLDAGPNIHLLYPDDFATIVKELKADIKPLCADGRIIEDIVGNGPEEIL